MVQHTDTDRLKSLFTNSEIESVEQLKSKDRRHPLERLLFPTDRDSAVLRNTEFSLSSIQSTAGPWLEKVKRRLLSENDYNSVSGALAEIRAYGYLSLVGAAVQPILETRSSSTCDFSIEAGGDRVDVEVYAKQADALEAKAQEQFQNQIPQVGPHEYLAIRMRPSTPLGEPKENENVTLRAIYKLLRMKSEEEKDNKQLSESHTTILGLDFQDETWDLIISDLGAVPLLSWHKQFYTGPIWYAF